jgi:hypothetical protein
MSDEQRARQEKVRLIDTFNPSGTLTTATTGKWPGDDDPPDEGDDTTGADAPR